MCKVIKKRFDSEPTYGGKYLKIIIKSYEGKTNVNFHDDKVPKEDSQYIYLSVVLILILTLKNCYPKVFLEECKYIVKEKR